jgi:hypothetical protein
VFLLILKRDRDRRTHERPHPKILKDDHYVKKNHIGGHFFEDAYGRDGHGHASVSKEIL